MTAFVAMFVSMAGMVFTVGSSPQGVWDFAIRFLPFAAAAVAIGMVGSTKAKNNKEAEKEQLLKSASGQALYFRPFTFDLSTQAHEARLPQGMFSESKIIVTLEEVLDASCLHQGLRLNCIGRLSNKLGPEEIMTDDAEWQRLALELMKEAKIILVIPGSSPGSFWEIHQIVSLGLLGKTLWLMPPAAMSNQKQALMTGWSECGYKCRQELRIAFPNFLSTGAMFSYDPDSLEITIRPFDFSLLQKCIGVAARSATARI